MENRFSSENSSTLICSPVDCRERLEVIQQICEILQVSRARQQSTSGAATADAKQHQRIDIFGRSAAGHILSLSELWQLGGWTASHAHRHGCTHHAAAPAGFTVSRPQGCRPSVLHSFLPKHSPTQALKVFIALAGSGFPGVNSSNLMVTAAGAPCTVLQTSMQRITCRTTAALPEPGPPFAGTQGVLHERWLESVAGEEQELGYPGWAPNVTRRLATFDVPLEADSGPFVERLTAVLFAPAFNEGGMSNDHGVRLTLSEVMSSVAAGISFHTVGGILGRVWG